MEEVKPVKTQKLQIFRLNQKYWVFLQALLYQYCNGKNERDSFPLELRPSDKEVFCSILDAKNQASSF